MHHVLHSIRKDSVEWRSMRRPCSFITPILCLLAFAVLNQPYLVAQSHVADSLWTIILRLDDTDTLKVDHLLDYSHALFLAGQPTRAKEIVDTALSMARKQRYNHGIVRALVGCALAEVRGGNRKKALALLEDAMLHARHAPDPRSWVKVYKAKGMLFLWSAQYDSAAQSLQRAEEVARTLPDSASYYDIVNLLGVVSHDRGDMRRAADYFHTVMEWALRKGDQKGLATALTNVANTMSNYDPDRALEYHQQALAIWENMGHAYGIATTLNNIAALQIKKRAFIVAAAAFKEAATLFEQLGMISHSLAAMIGLGNALLAMGKTEGLIEVYLQCLDHAHSMNDSVIEALVHVNLAEAYQRTGEIDKAVDHAMQSHQMASTTGTLERVMLAALRLSELSSIRGDHGASLSWYKRYIATRDSVEGKETQQKIHAIREHYEAGAREKEIHMLRQEGEMQSLMLVNQRNDLALRTAESDRRMQQLLLMERDREIDALELERRRHELLIERSDREKREQQLQLLDSDSKLKASLLDKAV
jgi:tetratricopeptide (TPR) repeat protein